MPVTITRPLVSASSRAASVKGAASAPASASASVSSARASVRIVSWPAAIAGAGIDLRHGRLFACGGELVTRLRRCGSPG
ncbi:MAG: hypothetical protein NVV62_13860 [Terricaulis sp.]|nr:hypothetical protein [Terricaulis sp.]